MALWPFAGVGGALVAWVAYFVYKDSCGLFEEALPLLLLFLIVELLVVAQLALLWLIGWVKAPSWAGRANRPDASQSQASGGQ